MTFQRIGTPGWTGSPKPQSKKKAAMVMSTPSIVKEKRKKYDSVESKYQIYHGRDHSNSRNSIYSITTPSLYSKRGSDVGINNKNKQRLAHLYKNNADVYANQRKNERNRKRAYKKQASSIMNKPLIYNIEKEESELDASLVHSHVKNLAPPKHLTIKPKDKNDIIRIEESNSDEEGDWDEETPMEDKPTFNEADHDLQKRALKATMKDPQVVTLKQQESEFDHSPHVTKSNLEQALRSHAQNPRLYTRSALSSNMEMGFYETPKVDLSEVDPFTGVKRTTNKRHDDLSVDESHALKTQSHAKIPDLDPYVQVIKTRSKDKSFWEEDSNQGDDLVRDPYAVEHHDGEHDLSLSLAQHMNLPVKPDDDAQEVVSHEIKSLEVQFHDLEIDHDIENLVADIFANPESTHDIERSHLSKLELAYESSRKQDKLREQLELEQDMSQMRESYLKSMAAYDQEDEDEDDMAFLDDL